MIRTTVFLIKALAIAIVSLLFGSCMGVSGNGHVKTEHRAVTGNFTGIEVSSGLSAHVTQGGETSITVEADDNLLPLIKTEVSNGVLKLYSDKPIRSGSKVHIYVSLAQITYLHASAGSLLEGKTPFSVKDLVLESSSGSELDATIQGNALNCSSSSGSSINLKGTAASITAKSSSGSSLNARELTVQDADADASSGSSISVSPAKYIRAGASSGASVNYYSGGAIKAETHATSGGSVSKG